jgi:hypothetical protein
MEINMTACGERGRLAKVDTLMGADCRGDMLIGMCDANVKYSLI